MSHDLAFRRGRREVALAVLVLLGAVAFAVGCSSVRLISDYDPIIDQSVTQLQKNVDLFLTRLESADPPAYADSGDFYARARVDLRAIQVRAAAQPKNEILVKQLDLVAENIDSLETVQREGVQDKAEIGLLRDAFATQFRAILKLELAKRRGEKP